MVNIAEVDVEIGNVGGDRDGTANVVGGTPVSAGLVKKETQEVEGIGIPGISVEYAPVPHFGPAQMAVPVQRDRVRKRVCRRFATHD
jgi:hypothetical protein